MRFQETTTFVALVAISLLGRASDIRAQEEVSCEGPVSASVGLKTCLSGPFSDYLGPDVSRVVGYYLAAEGQSSVPDAAAYLALLAALKACERGDLDFFDQKRLLQPPRLTKDRADLILQELASLFPTARTFDGSQECRVKFFLTNGMAKPTERDPGEFDGETASDCGIHLSVDWNFRFITEDSFALLACHELGHVMTGPNIKRDFRISVFAEGEADFFAASRCLPAWLSVQPNVLKDFYVDPLLNMECRKKPIDAKSEKICHRVAQAGYALLQAFQKSSVPKDGAHPVRFGQSSDVRYSGKDEGSGESHPAPQCRLETYLSGAKGVSRPVCFSNPAIYR